MPVLLTLIVTLVFVSLGNYYLCRRFIIPRLRRVEEQVRVLEGEVMCTQVMFVHSLATYALQQRDGLRVDDISDHHFVLAMGKEWLVRVMFDYQDKKVHLGWFDGVSWSCFDSIPVYNLANVQKGLSYCIESAMARLETEELPAE